MAETAWEPIILSAYFDPNPSKAGEPTVLHVMAIDVFGVEQEETRYAGEFQSGEV